MLIGLTGAARCGKDTLAGFLTVSHGFTRVAFADSLKAAALAANPTVIVYPDETGPLREAGWLGVTNNRYWEPHPVRLSALVESVGWDAAKACREVRAFLQRLGVAMRDHVGADVWVRAAMAQIDRGQPTVITDVRFPNEADAVIARGGVLVRVIRPEHADSLSGEAAAHVSETAMADYPADIEVFNGGTLEELAEAAATLSRFVQAYAQLSPVATL